RKFDKVCSVCGDLAANNNFGAITCCSCKIFFRRNGQTVTESKCSFGGNCVVSLKTRRFCQSCRLKKCFAVGMKTDSFLSEDKRQKIQTKYREKRLKLGSDSKDSAIDNCSDFSNKTTDDDFMAAIVSDNSFTDNEIQSEIEEINTLLTNNNDSKTNDLFTENSNTSVVAIRRPLTDYRNNFNEIEGNLLTEILFAINSKRESMATTPARIHNMTECRPVLTKKFTKEIESMSQGVKCLRAFNELCIDDQIALVKYGASDILSVRSVLLYDANTRSWTFNLDNNHSIFLPLDVFKGSKSNIYDVFETFFDKFLPQLDNDVILLDLLTAILLFNPNRPNLTHKQTIIFHQKSYIYLLKRYFLLKYRSEEEADTKYISLMNTMPYIDILGHLVWANGVRTEPLILGPLLREVLGLQLTNTH
ncbi:unnamed protein product, partial [Medioppia subpectinata]